MAYFYDSRKYHPESDLFHKVEEKMERTQQEIVNKSIKSETKIDAAAVTKKRSKKQSWGNKLAPIFGFAAFVHRYNLYRPYKYIPLPSGLGHFLGKIFLGRSKGMVNRIEKSYRALYPKISDRMVKKLTDTTLKYYGNLFINLIFKMPFATIQPIENFFEYENFEYLEEVLDKIRNDPDHNGILLLGSHIGQFIYPVAAFARHPNRFKMGAIGQLNNILLYRYLGNKADTDDYLGFSRLCIYGASEFRFIRKFLENHLLRNEIVLIYHDYSFPGQMRAPMIENQLPYLITTPQSHIALQRKTGAYIIPYQVIPMGGHAGIEKMKIRILKEETERIFKISEQYRNSPECDDKEYHGRLSVELNRIFYTHIRKYAHVWEEIPSLASLRLKDSIHFPKDINLEEFIDMIIYKSYDIINNSYEPNRDDEKIKEMLKNSLEQIKAECRKDPNSKYPGKWHRNPILTKNSFIDLSMLSGIGEISKMLSVLKKKLKEIGLLNLADRIDDLRNKISQN